MENNLVYYRLSANVAFGDLIGNWGPVERAKLTRYVRATLENYESIFKFCISLTEGYKNYDDGSELAVLFVEAQFWCDDENKVRAIAHSISASLGAPVAVSVDRPGINNHLCVIDNDGGDKNSYSTAHEGGEDNGS